MQNTRSSESSFSGDLARAGAGFTAVILGLITVFVCCQQNLDAPNLSQIGRGFGLDAAQITARIGGEAYMWQMVVAALSLVVFGYLSDLTNRKVLLFVAVMLGGAGYLAASLARTADQFIFLRALGGVGIGGIVPVVFSVIGDIFTVRTRAAATGIFMAVVNVGFGVGFMLGGLVGAEDAFGWRVSFVVESLLLMALAVVFLVFCRLPARGAADMRDVSAGDTGAEYTGRIRLSDIRKILVNPTNLIFILSCIIATAPTGFYQRFMADFFSVDIGLGEGGGTLIMLIVLSGSLLGDLCGGVLGDRLQRRDRRGPPLLAVASLVCGAGLFVLFFAFPYPSHPSWTALILPAAIGFIANALVEIPTPVSKAIMLDVNVPENRGTVAALTQVTSEIGFGIGALIGTFGPRLSSLLSMAHTRLFNFMVATLLFIPVALAWLAVVRTAPRDEKKLEALLRERPSGPKA